MHLALPEGFSLVLGITIKPRTLQPYYLLLDYQISGVFFQY